MIDLFGIWFDRLRASFIIRWGSPKLHNLQRPEPGRVIAAAPYKKLGWRGGNDLIGFVCRGVENPIEAGDVVQLYTKESGRVEFDVLRSDNRSEWGDNAWYGVGRLSKWDMQGNLDARCLDILSSGLEMEVRHLKKVLWGLVDLQGGEYLVRWEYLRTDAADKIEMESTPKGLLVKRIKDGSQEEREAVSQGHGH